MAHQIEIHRNGAAAFASARLSAWHRLGTVLEGALTAEQALEAALLSGWNVRKVPLTTMPAGEHLEGTPRDGQPLEVPGHFATVRTNPVDPTRQDVLGVVGARYEVIQNEEHTELLNALVDASGAHFETAGSLRGGREIFVSMRLPETMKVGGEDQVDLYIAGFNSHDGTSPFRFVITPIRVVCANTQAAALRTARASYAIRHTRRATSAIAQARQALELSFTYQETFEAEAEKMIQTTLTDAAFHDLITRLWEPPAESANAMAQDNHRERTDRLEWLFADAQTTAGIRGTRWAGYQAVTEYLDHWAPAKVGQWGPTPEHSRALNTITSPKVAALKHQAFELLTR